MAYAYKPLHYPGLAHAFLNTIMFLDYDRVGFPYPVVAFQVNCYGRRVIAQRGGRGSLANPLADADLDPPSPSPKRCMEVGAATARVDARQPLAHRPDRLVELVARLPHRQEPPALSRTSSRTGGSTRRSASGDYETWRKTPLAAIETSGQQEMLNWYMLAGAMEALGRKPDECEFIETWSFNSNKCFADVHALRPEETGVPTPTSQPAPRLHVRRRRARATARPEAQRRHPPPDPQARPAQLLVPGHRGPHGRASRKPVKVSLLGEEICLFRGAAGDVAAIQDICPHRGARLSEGDCHYQGTVACPYHGWVYDESGKNVMVLSEGPNSGVCGKAGTEAKAYPTRTLKGLVFVWIGDGDARAHRGGRARGVLRRRARSSSSARSTGGATGRSRSRTRWTRTSTTCTATRWWSRAAASSRAARRASTRSSWATASAATWPRATTCARARARTSYADGRQWPKTNYRRLWTWLTRPLAERARRHIPPPRSARWCGGHHLPGMFRAEFGWDLYTRMCVPVEEHLTRVWYYHCTAAEDRARARSGSGSSTRRCTGGSSSTTSRARTSA